MHAFSEVTYQTEENIVFSHKQYGMCIFIVHSWHTGAVSLLTKSSKTGKINGREQNSKSH